MAQEKTHNIPSYLFLIRSVQVILSVQLIVQFVLSICSEVIPYFDVSYNVYADMFGVIDPYKSGGMFLVEDQNSDDSSKYFKYVKLHIFLAGCNIALIQMLLRCFDVFLKLEEQAKKVEEMIRAIQLRHENELQSSLKMSKKKSSKAKLHQSKKMSEINSNKDLAELNKSRKMKEDRKVSLLSRLKIFLHIWLVRACAFVWAYMYHDYYGIVFILFIAHSMLYKSRKNFLIAVQYFYCPYVTLLLFFQILVNISGMNPFEYPYEVGTETTQKAYKLGFYMQTNPIAETAGLIAYVLCFYMLAHFLIKDKHNADFDYKMLAIIAKPHVNLLSQITMLFIIYAQLPLMIYLLINSLQQNDFYHILLLFAFMIFMSNNALFNKNAYALLIFSLFFVVEKYIYTLFTKQEPQGFWWEYTGFGTEYDPNTDKEYFRYQPKFDQWMLVLISFVIYSRVRLIGAGEEFEKAENELIKTLKSKLPKTARLILKIEILYYHCVVQFTILGCIVLLGLIYHSLINCISQLVILVCLGIYLQVGVHKMMPWWKVLIYWQALVLVGFRLFFFMIYANRDYETYFVKVAELYFKYTIDADGVITYITDESGERVVNTLFTFIGLRTDLTTAQWLSYMPYITLYTLVMIMKNSFLEKAKYENFEMKLIEDPKEVVKAFDTTLKFKINTETLDQFENNYIFGAKIKLSSTSSSNAFEEVSGMQQGMRKWLYKKTEEAIQELEENKVTINKFTEQYKNMKYQSEYQVYKIKAIEKIMNIIAPLTYLLTETFILTFSAYYQLALIWAIYLLIFYYAVFRVVWIFSSTSRKLRNNFMTIGKIKDKKENAAKEQYKTQEDIVDEKAFHVANIDTFLKGRKRRSTFQRKEQERILNAKEIYLKKEAKKTIEITDICAVESQAKFKERIINDKIKVRSNLWPQKYMLIVIALSLLYLSSYSSDFDQKLDKLIFGLYLSGLYCREDEGIPYGTIAAPYYVILAMFCLDKFSQMWYFNQFGLTKEKREIFESIEKTKELLSEMVQERAKKKEQEKEKERELEQSKNITLKLPINQAEPKARFQGPFAKSIKLDVVQKNRSIKFEKNNQEFFENCSQVPDFLPYAEQDFSALIFEQSSKNKQNQIYFNKIKDLDAEVIKQKRKTLSDEIDKLMFVKYDIKNQTAKNILTQAILAAASWAYVLYGQDVMSYFIFIVLATYTFTLRDKILNTSVFIVLASYLIVYWSSLINLSSYVTPRPFPKQLLATQYEDKDPYLVYPNAEHYYFNIPISFYISKWLNDEEFVTSQTVVDTEVLDYYGFFWTAEKKFPVLCWLIWLIWGGLMIIYLQYGFWPIKVNNIKVIQSKKLHQLVREINILDAFENKKKLKTNQEKLRELKIANNKIQESIEWRKGIFSNFHLITILIAIGVGIVSASLISFGYFIFAMVLIEKTKKPMSFRESSQKLIKWLIFPYMLLDLAIVLLFQLPIKKVTKFLDNDAWIKTIGIQKSWIILPSQIYFGESYIQQETGNDSLQVEAITTTQMSALMLKSAFFGILYIQIKIYESNEFKRFVMRGQKSSEEIQKTVSQSFAFIKNNHTSEQNLRQAGQITDFQTQLEHFKNVSEDWTTIVEQKKKDELLNQERYMLDHSMVNSKEQIEDSLLLSQISVSQNSNNVPERLQAKLSQQANFTRVIPGKVSTFIIQQQLMADDQLFHLYAQNCKRQSCCTRLYLYLRHKFVNEVLFRNSIAHMFQINQEVRCGATFIMNTIDEKNYRRSVNQLRWMTKKLTQFEIEQQALDKKEHLSNNMEKWKELNEEAMTKFPEKPVSCTEQTKKYLSLLKKILISHSHQVCYLMMLAYLLSNGGYLLLVYPIMIYGYALLQQSRPGKLFWYTILYYTQALLICTFLVQLDVWKFFRILDEDEEQNRVYEILIQLNMGVFRVPETNGSIEFIDMLIVFLPPTLVIQFVLLHIQFETESGIFDFRAHEIEPFKEGWQRYLNRRVYPMVPDRDQLTNNMKHVKTRKSAFNMNFLRMTHIAKQVKQRFSSETVKNEINFESSGSSSSSKSSDEENDYQTQESLYNHTKVQKINESSDSEQSYSGSDTHEEQKEANQIQEDYDGSPESIENRGSKEERNSSELSESLPNYQDYSFERSESKMQIKFQQWIIKKYEAKKLELRSWLGSDSVVQGQFDFEENKVYQELEQEIENRQKPPKCHGLKKFLSAEWFYQRPYIKQLFPNIKQQKPGIDFYSYICASQCVILFYVVLFWTNMTGIDINVIDQLTQNQLDGQMVLAVFCIIGLILCDRIIYATTSLLKPYDYEEDFQATERILKDLEETESEKFEDRMNSDENIRAIEVKIHSTFSKFQQSTLLQYDHRSKFLEIKNPQRWKLQSLEFEGSQTMQVHQKHLDFQKKSVTCVQVFKFPWLILIMTLVHAWLFVYLPRTSKYCILREEDTVTSVHACSILNSGFTVVFYMCFMVYFAFCAIQIKYGVPEVRYGSWLLASYDKINYYTHTVYMGIPFIFELRSIIDWTFQSTALDVFQWLKLAQIQADMYKAKCYNRPYMAKEIGSTIKFVEKFFAGFCLIIIVMILITFPIFLFSSLNPTVMQIEVATARLQLYMNFEFSGNIGLNEDDQYKTNLYQLLFSTAVPEQNNHLTDQQWQDTFGVGDGTFSLDGAELDKDALTLFQFSTNSGRYWNVPQETKKLALGLIQKILRGELSNDLSIQLEFYYTFVPNSTEDFKFDLDEIANLPRGSQYLNLRTVRGLNNLREIQAMLDCRNPDRTTETRLEMSEDNHITSGIYVSDSNSIKTIERWNPKYDMAAYNLGYTCMNATKIDTQVLDPITNTNTTVTEEFYQGYWTLTQEPKDETSQPINELWNTSDQPQGLGFYVFQGKQFPDFLAALAPSISYLYISIVLVIGSTFRSVFVPQTHAIYITDGPHPDEILIICQLIHIYRYRRQHLKEEATYMLLIDRMRSPQVLKNMNNTSIKQLPNQTSDNQSP